MKDRDEAKDELTERMGQRFGNDDKSAEEDKDVESDKEVKQDKQTMQAKQDNSAKNYKDVWGSKLIHLPDDLMDPVDGEFDRMQYECDWTVKKEQHYYPVVVSAGIEAVSEMSVDEFTESVENLGLR